MSYQEAFTTFTIVKLYRALTGEVLKIMLPVAENVKQRSLSSHKPEWEVKLTEYKNHRIIYTAFYSRQFAQEMVYLLKPGKGYLEVFGYDEKQGRYHYYHEHFLERYTQRFHLQHKLQEEVAVHYFSHNPFMVYGRERKINGELKDLYALVNLGVILGYIDSRYRIINFRTILYKHDLTKKKKKQSYVYLHKLHELQKGW